jgi:hypothetical protein
LSNSTANGGTIHPNSMERICNSIGTRRGKVTAAILVSFIVILAAVGVTLLGPGGGEGTDGSVDIRSLEPFNNTGDGGYDLVDGGAFPLTTFDIEPIPEEIREIVIVLINTLVLEVTWHDEPDITYLVATWENQPDTFRAILRDHNGTFDEVDETANPIGGEGRITLRWDGGDTYIGSALVRVSNEDWKGVNGWEYVDLKGGNVLWKDGIDAMIMLVESGDYVNQRIPYVFADDGNHIEITFTLAGYYLSIPPPGE